MSEYRNLDPERVREALNRAADAVHERWAADDEAAVTARADDIYERAGREAYARYAEAEEAARKGAMGHWDILSREAYLTTLQGQLARASAAMRIAIAELGEALPAPLPSRLERFDAWFQSSVPAPVLAAIETLDRYNPLAILIRWAFR